MFPRAPVTPRRPHALPGPSPTGATCKCSGLPSHLAYANTFCPRIFPAVVLLHLMTMTFGNSRSILVLFALIIIASTGYDVAEERRLVTGSDRKGTPLQNCYRKIHYLEIQRRKERQEAALLCLHPIVWHNQLFASFLAQLFFYWRLKIIFAFRLCISHRLGGSSAQCLFTHIAEAINHSGNK